MAYPRVYETHATGKVEQTRARQPSGIGLARITPPSSHSIIGGGAIPAGRSALPSSTTNTHQPIAPEAPNIPSNLWIS